MTDRLALADFLRRRRARLAPSDVGLPLGRRRRTPGLRREEVAQLAGMSSDYYTRLEQARGANPSELVVGALARALRCNDDERDHLFRLAGFVPPPRGPASARLIRPGVMSLAQHLGDVPVAICSDLHEMLWLNDLAEIVLGVDLEKCSGLARNYTWRCFTDAQVRGRFSPDDWPRYAAVQVSDLRAARARNAGDDDYANHLVTDLRARSAEFRELWDRHEVTVRHSERKRMFHPLVGALPLTCEIITPEPGLKAVVYFPTEGTDARRKLDVLRAGIGDRRQ